MLGLPQTVTACLFDMDGVLTRTASVHRAAWRRTFEAVLAEHTDDPAIDTGPFTDADYARHVDGKPRRDGVRDFLTSRGVHLPEGEPDDPPTVDTVAGVGNRKNELLQAELDAHGVEVFEGSVRYLHAAREAGLRTAVVTASANGEAVLAAGGLSDLLEVRIDAVVAAERGLAGKPAPDTFLAAAQALGVEPGAAVVFEDAQAGVAAGRAGHFGYVVGVDRSGDPASGQAAALLAGGADVVVDDLADLLVASDPVPGAGS